MFVPLRDVSIRKKLMRASLTVGATVLLCSCLSFAGYGLWKLRNVAAEHMDTDADIIGIDVTSALIFLDPNAAGESLAALRAIPSIISAAVYDHDGMLFAKYVRNHDSSGVAILPLRLAVTPGKNRIERNELIVTRQILVDGKPIGMVYIQSDLSEIQRRIRSYAVISVGILTVSFGIALVVASALARRISAPLLSLAETARTIASRRDYSVRAPVHGKDETGILAEAFNEMLQQIEEQNGTLRKSEAEVRQINAELERRVIERTEKLSIANENLANASKAKDRFLASMSHELRTPLNGIIGFGEFLSDGKPGPVNEKQKEYLGDILNSGRHLLHLINDMLDLVKVQAGKVELFVENFRLSDAINEVCAGVRPIAETKRIEMKIEIAPGLDFVTLDKQRFKQILYNLLSNALKFTNDGGHVVIEVRPQDAGRFQLAVTDDGIGIRQEDIGRLFTEFEQLETGTARRFGGTGLGLALTRSLVALHGGVIDVESEIGKGSTFRVVLPLIAGKENT